MPMLVRGSPAVDLRARLERLREVDWDFPTSESQSSFSSLHWHPCRFPSQVPAVIIGALTSPGEVVLDPFVGSGTTAVEAQRLQRMCIGIEINPVAALISRAKTISRPWSEIHLLARRIRMGIKRNIRRAPIPGTVQAKKWYTERTISDLRRLSLFIGELSDDERLIAEAAFSAILLPVCRETRHWGYVCDNTSPKGDYERNVIDIFEQTVENFEEAYRARDEYWATGDVSQASFPEVKIVEGDARSILAKYPSNSVHLIVTSPPYFGVTDYAKAQRLSFEWLGKDIEPVRQLEIGARSKRHRISAAEEYIEDCTSVFAECRRVLKKGRACVVLFGESTERAPLYSRFLQAVESCGLTLEYSAKRKISSRRRQKPSLQLEHLLLFV